MKIKFTREQRARIQQEALNLGVTTLRSLEAVYGKVEPATQGTQRTEFMSPQDSASLLKRALLDRGIDPDANG